MNVSVEFGVHNRSVPCSHGKYLGPHVRNKRIERACVYYLHIVGRLIYISGPILVMT